ncbi:MAG TPA: LytR C-terminal domain-containing protein [Nocardioides sp.]|nr:LytR C-terminal domain-containing protein [Nocardioides sp.]
MRGRSDRGAVFPSPVVMLSILAVVMAGVAYVATRGDEPTERKVTTVSQDPTAEDEPTTAPPTKEPKKPKKPAFKRGETYVVVFNNSGISGLAGRIAGAATDAGWNVVGSDNWYGTIPANTVYYPKPLKAAAEQLALDLGIQRTAPAVDPMQLDRLTVILTGEL